VPEVLERDLLSSTISGSRNMPSGSSSFLDFPASFFGSSPILGAWPFPILSAAMRASNSSSAVDAVDVSGHQTQLGVPHAKEWQQKSVYEIRKSSNFRRVKDTL
jgi:hypothetical protein